MGLTVDSLANTVPAISALDRPRATAVNTSRSLSLSPRLGDVLGTPPPAGDPNPSSDPNPSGDPSRAGVLMPASRIRRQLDLVPALLVPTARAVGWAPPLAAFGLSVSLLSLAVRPGAALAPAEVAL